MATGVLKRCGTKVRGCEPVLPGSVQIGNWQQIHDDLKASAETTNLLTPLSASSANVHPVKVPDGASRVMLRVKRLQAATVTTSPVIRVFGANGALTAAEWFLTDGTVGIQRLDRHDTGGGITVAMSATLDFADATYRYSPNALHTTDMTPWLDCRGSEYVFALVETAYGGDAASSTVVLEVAFLN